GASVSRFWPLSASPRGSLSRHATRFHCVAVNRSLFQSGRHNSSVSFSGTYDTIRRVTGDWQSCFSAKWSWRNALPGWSRDFRPMSDSKLRLSRNGSKEGRFPIGKETEKGSGGERSGTDLSVRYPGKVLLLLWEQERSKWS